MDQVPLVGVQIDDGGTLVARLMQKGFPVTAASWVKESDGGPWYLYLVSPAADSLGPREGYRRVQEVIRQMPSFAVGLTEVKLIGTEDSVAQAIIAIRDRFPGRGSTWFPGNHLGDLAIDGAFVYGPVSEFKASETRHGVA
jgi:hypothetical protein